MIRLALVIVLTLTATVNAADPISIRTNGFELRLATDADGRLVQTHLGTPGGPDDRSPQPFHPAYGAGYLWEPAVMATHADGNTSTDLTVVGHSSKVDGDVTETRVELHDPAYPFTVAVVFRAYAEADVVEQWAEIRHGESGPVTLGRFASSAPTVPGRDVHLTHFYGKWADEMNLVEERLTPGTKLIDSKLGVRADYYASPSFVLSLDEPAQEETGRTLAGQLAWSGSFALAFERADGHVRAVCGANSFASAYRLPPNVTFRTPAMVWAYSDHGKGAVSRNVHRWARQHVLRGGGRPRPVLLNNWEATEFKFDEPKLVSLFEQGRAVGADVFLLDDGWFGNTHPRDDDHAGLGDWQVNARKLPRGLSYLTDEAHRRGLRFGLWFEPEMVNPRSDLFEQHPDWVIRQPNRKLDLFRNQLILDLTRPAVREFVFRTMDDALTQNPGITYVKWDCNRYVTQGGSPYLPVADQANLWVDYVNALYDVMARVADRHPTVQMMACSGGGGRVDYGVLQYFDSFWPSDNTDPVRRVKIQWGYSHLFPACCTCGHVTHMGHRPLKFAFDVASSGALGMDLDLAKLPEADRAFAAAAVATYKSVADVVTGGDLYRLESPYAGPRAALAYVSPDRARAVLFAYGLGDGEPTPIVLRGLAPARRYRVAERNLRPGVRSGLADDGQAVDGATLMSRGLVVPVRHAAESAMVELTAER